MAMPATPREASAVERMTALARARGLQVFGPSSFVVPEADPGTPAFCVSSQRRNGAWHMVWMQTVDGVQRLMCSCPARRRASVVTCSHAQAVRLHLAAQCAARASRPTGYVESRPVSVDAPSAVEGVTAPGLGTAEALRRAEFDRALDEWLAEQRRDTPFTFTIVEPDRPTVPPDAVESRNAWSDALYAESLAEQMAADDARDPKPAGDDDDDPDPTPPPAAAAAAAAAAVEACPSCGQLAHAEDVRQIGTCLDCVLARADDDAAPAPAEQEQTEQQPAQEQTEQQPAQEQTEQQPKRAHCPRCARVADVDDLVEHGICPVCVNARPYLSWSSRRTPAQKAATRRRIIEAERERQTRYRRTGRADDWRRSEEARERDARRRERRESDDNAHADHETAPLYRDNRPISPFRETRAHYTTNDTRDLGADPEGNRYALTLGYPRTVIRANADTPTLARFYCTWSSWLTTGHRIAGVTINTADGTITGAAFTKPPTPQPKTDPRALEIRLMRLGGAFERARQDRDYARAVDIGHEIARTGDQLPEDYAWHLTVLRGRNVIRRARGLEPIHS